ncbi:hypothetical protein PybrP1_013084 [[Pythium] brassicae (nom. inval.)]|nr:hypothetical protein PybrP1_013084 [[Pythium] brassicae (nom. inval.)]
MKTARPDHLGDLPDFLFNFDDPIRGLCDVEKRSPAQTAAFKERLRMAIRFVDAQLCKPPPGEVCVRHCKKICAEMCVVTVPCNNPTCRQWHDVEVHLTHCKNDFCELDKRILARETLYLILDLDIQLHEAKGRLAVKQEELATIETAQGAISSESALANALSEAEVIVIESEGDENEEEKEMKTSEGVSREALVRMKLETAQEIAAGDFARVTPGGGKAKAPNPCLSLCIASALKGEAEQLRARFQHLNRDIRALQFDVLDETHDDGKNDGTEGVDVTLDALVAQADCVVALVPEPAQLRVAQACVKHATPLVTASYASPGIQTLDAAARAAGIPLLCEMGLDPGMDHMIAMTLIARVKANGGRVATFSSVCGGLPAPDAANNPIKYKFSWSPHGALRAAQRPAQYLRAGNVVTVAGADVLAHRESVRLFPPHALEQIPNGNALPYAAYYGIPDATSLFRGTLRFTGFCQVVHECVQLGLLDEGSRVERDAAWREILARRMKACGAERLGDATQVFLHWLGVSSPGCVVATAQSTMWAFADLLVDKLAFAEGERDLVLLHVAVGAEYPDGTRETLEAFFDALGDAGGDTIMAKTVGVTAAIGAQLVLSKQLTGAGLVRPTHAQVYEPALALLAAEGIVFREQVTTQE